MPGLPNGRLLQQFSERGQERGDPIASVRHSAKMTRKSSDRWSKQQGLKARLTAYFSSVAATPLRSPIVACFHRIRMGLGVNEVGNLHSFTVAAIAKVGPRLPPQALCNRTRHQRISS
jgi:hypothetical protein